jgi:hypothetical protein
VNLYSINMIVDDRVSIVVSGEFGGDAQAINAAHYWLGYHRAASARLYRGLYIDAGPGDDAELIREISSPC